MSLDIDQKLSKCGILDKLRLNSKKYVSVTDSKNLLATYEQHIFVWHDNGSCILTTEINYNLDEKIQKFTNTNHSLNHRKDDSYKTLTLTNPPVFEVDSLIFNQTGSLLALSGKCGVTIYEVPWRYGKFGTAGVNGESIIGRSWNIAELFFICSNRAQVVHTAWHPGSTSKTHITVLSTDNYIRIYDVNNPQVPEQAIPLGANYRSSFLSSEAKMSFSSCYGENAVSFDFGPPENLSVTKATVTHGIKTYESKKVWPIYLLHGNGDVFILKATLKKEKNNSVLKLEGPLAMYPPSEDNYGYDACAILCLHSTPSTLVIATASGVIYHCLVLENTSASHVNEQEAVYGRCKDECSEALYVFESVELPLSLTEDQEDVYTDPIRLYKDIISHSKYHCTHVSGLHSVAMPFLQAVEESTDTDNLKQLLNDRQKQPCIVEHILCTKPFSQMKAIPVLGLDCTVSDGGIILICLLASWEFVSFSVVSSFLPPSPCLLSKESSCLKEEKPFCSTFEQSLEKTLQRSLCSPVVKSFSSDKDISTSQQWLDLLCNVTQRFREDYIQRLTTAHALLRSRSKVLAQQKEYQLNDIKRCEQEKENLRRGVEHLAEKYEDAQAIQQDLQKRVENVLKKLHLHLPYLSRAEVDMKQTLLTYEDKLKTFESSLDQIKKKLKYQQEKTKEFSEMTGKLFPEGGDLKKASFNETQMKHVKELLIQEGESIAEILQNVTVLKKELGLG